MFLRNAKNGCGSNVCWKDKLVFHSWDKGNVNVSFLGKILNKGVWIQNNVENSNMIERVQKLLIDWELYENGWWVKSYDNEHLFYYLCQMGTYGSYPPKELKYIY